MIRLARPVSLLLALLCAAGAHLAAQTPTFEPISAVTPARLQQFVYIQGDVVTHRQPWNERAPHLMTVRDATGTIDVVFWRDTFAAIEGKDLIAPGARVMVYAEVDEYRGAVQLRLAQPNHLRVFAAGTAPGGDAAVAVAAPAASGAAPGGARPIAIGNITTDLLQQQVIVRGRVLQVNAPTPGARVPYRVTLEDATGTVMMVYWEDLAAKIPPASRPTEGGVFEVAGKVDEHRGAVQLRLERPDGIRPVQAGQSPSAGAAAAPPTTALPSFATSTMPPPPGTGARSEPPAASVGAFQSVDPFNPQASAAVPQLVEQAPPPAQSAPIASAPLAPPPPSQSPWGSSPPPPTAGAATPPPAPTGASQPFMPPPPGASSAMPPPPGVAPGTSAPLGAPAAPGGGTTIGSITGASAGMTLTVSGKVERVTKTSNSMLIRLNDGTGRLSVFVSSAVMANARNLAPIEQGWTLRVEGVVKIYNERPELHPASAAAILDVKRP